MSQVQRPYETMTDDEKRNAYCVVATWYENNLTNSTYVLGAESAQQAAEMAYSFFTSKSTGKIFRLEVLPKGKGRYSNVDYEYAKTYAK